MRFPSPDDPASALVWDNYVAAQAAQALLGLVPLSALAVGVVVDREHVVLRFRLSGTTATDLADMTDVANDLQDLLGPAVRVDRETEVMPEQGLDPHEGVIWIYRARTDG